MYIPKLSSSIFFIVGIVLFTYLTHFYNGYNKAKQEGLEGSYIGYVTQQVRDISEGIKLLPEVGTDAQKSLDDITIGSMLKIQQALLMYNLDTKYYPNNINELFGNYISSDNKTVQKESFRYRKTSNGYIMSVKLPVSGETYTIRE